MATPPEGLAGSSHLQQSSSAPSSRTEGISDNPTLTPTKRRREEIVQRLAEISSLFSEPELSRGLLIDVFTRTDRDDFNEARAGTIDDPDALRADSNSLRVRLATLFRSLGLREYLLARIGLSA
jgi:hypothetical protein